MSLYYLGLLKGATSLPRTVKFIPTHECMKGMHGVFFLLQTCFGNQALKFLFFFFKVFPI